MTDLFKILYDWNALRHVGTVNFFLVSKQTLLLSIQIFATQKT